MREKRFTMNRRTFIKTTGGLVIIKTFSGRLAPAHAANPPSSLEFKATVARWLAIGQSGALDSAQQGQITVTPAGGSATAYPIVDGNVSFSIPNNVTSQIVVQVGDMAHRNCEAGFDTGTLVIKNKDYADTPLVYHWMDLENAYVLEYWQESLYVTGPADPGGYFVGFLYKPLSPLISSGRLPLGGNGYSHHPPEEPPYNPPEEGGDNTGPNGLVGIPDNNTGVDTGSSPDKPAGSFDAKEDEDKDGCGAGSREGYPENDEEEKKTEYQAADMLNLREIRVPIIPSLAALERKMVDPMLENLNFGGMLQLLDPSGNEMGAVFVGLNQEQEIAGGITFTLTHLLAYPIDQVVINSTWPRELLATAEPGVYRINFWAQTSDGLSSNKRFIYFRIIG